MTAPPIQKTTEAFSKFRQAYKPPKTCPPHLIANEDQKKPMNDGNGLLLWQDGPAGVNPVDAPGVPVPVVSEEDDKAKYLWVIREDDVPYAAEACDFGKTLESKVIKHSNLTGGGTAYAGGELLILDKQTIVLNGSSGRYGPRSSQELQALARAFRESGYFVWYMAYDNDAGRALPFVGTTPIWMK
jgi:hypothetical protein